MRATLQKQVSVLWFDLSSQVGRPAIFQLVGVAGVSLVYHACLAELRLGPFRNSWFVGFECGSSPRRRTQAQIPGEIQP